MSSTAASDLARAVLVRRDGERIVLQVPHSDYELHLRLDGATDVAPGKRVSGVIDARAQRIHATTGGGHFIEPVIGEPRILTGRVLEIDEAGRRVLVRAVLPMWLHTGPDQDFSVFEPGGLVTGYVASGTTFRPA